MMYVICSMMVMIMSVQTVDYALDSEENIASSGVRLAEDRCSTVDFYLRQRGKSMERHESAYHCSVGREDVNAGYGRAPMQSSMDIVAGEKNIKKEKKKNYITEEIQSIPFHSIL